MNTFNAITAIATQPELQYTTNGTAILTFTIAQKGQRGVNYLNAKLLGKYAQSMAEVLEQGMVVSALGRLNHNTWETDDGKAERFEIILNNINPLDTELELETDRKGSVYLLGGHSNLCVKGNITRDPTSGVSDKSGDAFDIFTVAVNESFKTRDGEWKERVHFVPVNAWLGGLNLSKGQGVVVLGELSPNRYESEQGVRYSVQIRANQVLRVLGKGEAKPTSAEEAGEPSAPVDELPDDVMPF